MKNMIVRNLFRTTILVLVTGLVIGAIYALSFTSLGAATNQREFSLGQGSGQFQNAGEDAELLSGQGGGFGQGNGFGGGHHGGGQGLGRGLGEGRGDKVEFSFTNGLAEIVKNLIVITVLIIVVALLQNLAKRRQRVTPAA